MLKAYKYRIYPTESQIVLIEKTFSICRLVYNLALQTKIEAYKSNGTKLSSIDLCYQLVDLKKDYEWMKEVDSQALQASIKKVDKSFLNFFRGNGYPKFKSKKDKQSFHCPHNARKIDFVKSLLTIPKIKNIPIVISRKFCGKIKTVTISRTITNKYFASILVDDEQLPPIKKEISESTSIGIDVGVKHFAILSDGTKIENPKILRNNLIRLRCLQKRLSRKVKGSNNRTKAKLKVAAQHEKISNQRNDFLHKLSSVIIKQYDTTCVEDLSIKNMIKNRNLSLSISDAGWGEFYRQLKYKQRWNGGNYMELPRFHPSSKLCSNCGIANKLLTLADRKWTCENCGKTHDRDINAAMNIKQYFFKKPMGNRG